MAVTYDEAKHCPRCNEVGEEVSLTLAPASAKLPKGTKYAQIYCRNSRCKWYNTPWTVQLNTDGTVPDPQDHTKREKLYVGFESHDDKAKALIDKLKSDAQYETQTGAEFRGHRF